MLKGPSISAEELGRKLHHPDLVVLDASWYLPGSGRDPLEDFEKARIPGARFYDLDAACDPESELPHTVPSPERFRRKAEALGITADSWVVVYDGSGKQLSAPRVWWTFRYFSHERIAVLDGGFDAWIRGGRAIQTGPPAHARARGLPYDLGREPRPVRHDLIRHREDVVRAIRRRAPLIVDVRPEGRFLGRDPEPRAGLGKGHIPGSQNLPFTSLVKAETGLAINSEELLQRLGEAGARKNEPIIATCGSGTSACALAWSLERAGWTDVAVYDGSWADWGRPGKGPIETGPAAPPPGS